MFDFSTWRSVFAERPWLMALCALLAGRLVAAPVVGALLLFIAGRPQTFSSLFIVMLLYSTCYAATLPLVNAVLFKQVPNDNTTQGLVFIWAPIAWALVGYGLSGWRLLRKGEGDGSDCLKLAALLSLVMAIACLCLPATAPAQSGGAPILKAVGRLAQGDFLLFFITSVFVSGMMQFYFLGSAQFMMNMGISGKAVPASMASAQVAQAIATYFALGFCLTKFGFQWTLTIGAACWLVMYVAYVLGKPKALVLAVQPLHGLAYVMFIIVGQIFAGAVGADAPSSMQALIFAATVGVGMFLGTQLAGVVMDKF